MARNPSSPPRRRIDRVGMLAGSLLTLAIVGPVAFAVVALRCCGSASGASWQAWVVIGLAVAALCAIGAVLGAALAALARGGFVWISGFCRQGSQIAEALLASVRTRPTTGRRPARRPAP